MSTRVVATAALAAGAAAASAALIWRSGILKKPEEAPVDPPPGASPRLPRGILPKSYDVSLVPDLDSCQFAGKLKVSVRIEESTKYIILNVADIQLKDQSVVLKTEGGTKDLVPVAVEVDATDELLILRFAEDLPLGDASLHMEYEGTLNDQMKGFYRSTYTLDGQTKNMGVTQFEPADARRCFPCWDEPAFKATFLITVEIPKHTLALSNMPVDKEIVTESKRILRFKESPLMSTYLVALVVGEFDYIEETTEEGTPVRVYTEIGSKELGRFALDVAVKTLPFFTRYFGTAYPLPKLDMIAIPDFAAGAMENYGLITYRSAALLVDPVGTAAANKQRIAITVTHELAHQWFGNLVTMEWWTHLWLNEGFASWVSYLATDYLFPEWNVWTQFNTTEMSTAFRLDGLQESHPIEVEVGHVREIDEIFDAISYSKGASVIRMLQSYLGADAFQQGLCQYVQKFAYKNASTEDLWAALATATGEPVSELMQSWTRQMGYPVLAVTLAQGALKVHQEQYLSLGVPGTGEWVIPVTLIQGKYTNYMSILVRGQVSTIGLPAPLATTSSATSTANGQDPLASAGGRGWVKLNVRQAGFYRVQYDDELASRLVEAVKEGQLEAADRFGLLDDGYALSRAGKQPLGALIRLLQAYKGEEDFTVLRSVCEISASTATILGDALPDTINHFRSFAASLIRNKAAQLGWEGYWGESHLESMLRGTLQDMLVALRDDTAIVEGRHRFQDFLKDRTTNRLPPDLRKAAYRAVLLGVTEDNLSGYEALLQVYRETEMSEEKARVLSALGAGPDAVVKRALQLILTPEVRPQDAIYLLGGLGVSTRDTAWAWLQEKWDEVYARWGEGFLIARFVLNCCSSFCTEEKAVEIETFFNRKDSTPIRRTVKQCTERVRTSARQVGEVREEEGLAELIKKLASGVKGSVPLA